MEVVANGARFHLQRLRPPRRAPGTLPDPLDGLTVVVLQGPVMASLPRFYRTLGSAAAQTGAEVILYDLLGHGLSDPPPSSYTVEDSINDLDAILDALGVAAEVPVHLVGNGYGSMIALGMAIAQPRLVAGMVLIEAHGIAEGGWDAPGWDPQPQVGGFLRTVSRSLPFHDDEILQRLTDRWGRNFTHAARTARSADARSHGTNGVQGATLASDPLAAELFSEDALAEIGCPVLALYGERSDLVERGYQLAGAIAGCTLERLPDQTHAALTEDTARLRDIVLSWFATTAAGAAGVPPRQPEANLAKTHME